MVNAKNSKNTHQIFRSLSASWKLNQIHCHTTKLQISSQFLVGQHFGFLLITLEETLPKTHAHRLLSLGNSCPEVLFQNSLVYAGNVLWKTKYSLTKSKIQNQKHAKHKVLAVSDRHSMLFLFLSCWHYLVKSALSWWLADSLKFPIESF